MKTRPLPTPLLILLLVVLATPLACSRYRTQSVEIYKNQDVLVALSYELAPGGLPLKRGFHHPVEISPEHMAALMTELQYADPLFLWKEKERPIFSEAEITLLTPHFIQALARATADQMVHFSIRSWKKDMVFGSEKFTSGVFFINDEGVNWAFGNVNVEGNQEDQMFHGNPTQSVPKSVQVRPREGQKNYVPKERRWYEAKVFPNWVVGPPSFEIEMKAETPAVVPVSQPQPVSPPPPPAPAPAPVAKAKKPVDPAPPPAKSVMEPLETTLSGGDDPTARLRKLKTLRDEKLISEKDYEEKKREILRDL